MSAELAISTRAIRVAPVRALGGAAERERQVRPAPAVQAGRRASAGPGQVARRSASRTRSGAEMGRAERRRRMRVHLAAGGLVLLVGLFHAWTGLRVGQLGYALSDARVLTERLDQELHELTIEYAAETAPARLESEARARLGLRPPAPGQVVVPR